ncbi:MAG: MarR family winged helix-turn-helix transcriptional regulator [Burkholderiaceae bacterium]|jgi:DNA-binding MarR family transcriptional regulator|nr:MarR family winged helix-turn-helix transcriptional regulator [Burkholderiaceae bacterium]
MSFAPRAPDPVCTCFMVRSLSRKISQLYDDTLAPSGLRGTQFSLLVQARRAHQAPPTVSALAEQLHTDRTTLTRNLRTLQQAGCIELVPGTDARSRCVVVTAQGQAKIREAAALWRLAQQRVRELCGLQQIAALESLVLDMLPVLEAQAPALAEDAA